MILCCSVHSVSCSFVCVFLPKNHGLRVLGGNKLLEVLGAVEYSIGLLVAVQIQGHVAMLAFEAELVVDFVASLLPLLCVYRLAADLALLCLRWLPRHD